LRKQVEQDGENNRVSHEQVEDVQHEFEHGKETKRKEEWKDYQTEDESHTWIESPCGKSCYKMIPQRKMLRPRGRIVVSIDMKILNDKFVDNFRITISLRMERS
jgi:ABC-type Zn2+ transport system substrate-binding protein/surface adhesin